MTPSGPPDLISFDRRASWLNRAGRIDRSACVELKASDLWPSIPDDAWQKRAHDRTHTPGAIFRKDTRPFLLAEAPTQISAYHLANLHDTKNPVTLQGDLRTTKSNVLKPAFKRNATPAPTRGTTSSPRSPRSPNVGAPSTHHSNPNKGQSRTKMLGLPTDWFQILTIQRWRLHAKLAQHFFACPKCERRALKLFLPLCTEQELHDANLANLWLVSNKQRIARSITLRPQASELINRYAPLFPPRQLQCRKCLALRYGEARRQIRLEFP